MATLLDQQRLTAEIKTLEDMIASLPENDILGRLSVGSRLEEVQRNLGDLQEHPATKAEVALVFHGRPVHGSTAIQASFGTKALDAFQRAVSTSYALHAQEGHIGQRGPAPATDLSSLHITGITQGSFGFVLEELAPNGDQWLDSALKIASDTVVTVLERLSSNDPEDATLALEDINDRLFSNIRDLVKLVKENDASFQLALPDRVADLGDAPLQRAYERIANATLEDTEITLSGVLEGILPEARRFEFRTEQDLIRGKVARSISEEYISSLRATPMVGRNITAVFRKRTVRDYASTPKDSYTLIRLIPELGAPSHVL